MIKFVSRRLIRVFFFSFIWVTIPASIFFIPNMYEARIEAGKHLTPYSVSVSGYYRKDGTYVRPHNRRPPGSVEHDAPYLATRRRLFWGITGLVLLSFGSAGGVVIFSIKEIKNRKFYFHEYIQSYIISKIKMDVSDLVDKPKHVINRLISRHDTTKMYYCISCKRLINRNEFHYSSLAVRNPSKKCIDCMSRNKAGATHQNLNPL